MGGVTSSHRDPSQEKKLIRNRSEANKNGKYGEKIRQIFALGAKLEQFSAILMLENNIGFIDEHADRLKQKIGWILISFFHASPLVSQGGGQHKKGGH